MGGLRYHDRLSLSFFIDKGNGESFFESLEKLNNFVGTEWVKQGNKLELYERIGSIVLVILDNASYHKRQDIPSENRASTTKYTTRVFTSLQSKFQFN
jgi:hypothetical protein